ncbi:MAG: hypothetical protein QXS90_01195 [Candidatus Diapherotrites archaeon]
MSVSTNFDINKTGIVAVWIKAGSKEEVSIEYNSQIMQIISTYTNASINRKDKEIVRNNQEYMIFYTYDTNGIISDAGFPAQQYTGITLQNSIVAKSNFFGASVGDVLDYRYSWRFVNGVWTSTGTYTVFFYLDGTFFTNYDIGGVFFPPPPSGYIDASGEIRVIERRGFFNFVNLPLTANVNQFITISNSTGYCYLELSNSSPDNTLQRSIFVDIFGGVPIGVIPASLEVPNTIKILPNTTIKFDKTMPMYNLGGGNYGINISARSFSGGAVLVIKYMDTHYNKF